MTCCKCQCSENAELKEQLKQTKEALEVSRSLDLGHLDRLCSAYKQLDSAILDLRIIAFEADHPFSMGFSFMFSKKHFVEILQRIRGLTSKYLEEDK